MFPDRAAIVHGDLRWNYARFGQEVGRLAGALRRAGIGAGDRVAVLLPNTPVHLAAHFALPLIEACVARGVPLFGICRGFQEMNVAGGGSLHPEIRELPGRMNHRMPRLETGEIHPDPAVVFADRHEVRLASDGVFARILGRDLIRVNSLHGQGILDVGDAVVAEGIAEDGTIEAIRMRKASGFALGVQWHAEYDPQTNPVNKALFEAFGEAVRDYRKRRG